MMLDESSSVDIIYLDFQKAFDKAPHGRLLDKIRNAGIANKIVDWIENWLDERLEVDRICVKGFKLFISSTYIRGLCGEKSGWTEENMDEGYYRMERVGRL